jgi:malate synthase
MEDAATAEISRAQVWQWVHHRARLEDGAVVDAAHVRAVVEDEMRHVEQEVGSERFRNGRFAEACDLFLGLSTAETLEEFLTIPAYGRID